MRTLGDIFPPELADLDPLEKGRILVNALWKPPGGVVIEDRPEAVVAICPACGTADGWVWSDEPAPGCPVGTMVPCPACREPRMRQRELARMFDEMDMPEAYRTLTPESYAAMPHADLGALARVEDIRARGPASAYLYGQTTGVGKTWLAWHLVRSWMEAGATGVLVITAPELLDRLRAGYADHASVSADEVFEATKRAPILVLDDLGSSKVTEWVVERLFVLVDHREKHHLPTIYTSNLSLDGLEETLGPRTVSRLRKHAGTSVIWVDGVDQRRVAS